MGNKHGNLQVFAMRIFAFSNRLGQFVPMVLSRIKPEEYKVSPCSSKD